ncbi:hypothetical protein GCM10028778_12160 [Barrientosiimonas marina]|uniref:Type 1 glutamine amidotransferase domain-containing protein n=1 Tax=Lentibacillus kimchii TaxID=1542911 RepID=A0ABW2UV38_9BACI
MPKNILMVVTNHEKITEEIKSGIWLSEFAEAYNEFKEQGYTVMVASPQGGKSPVDQSSIDDQTPQAILDAQPYLEETVKLDELDPRNFDAIFLPGGHGAMYDLPENQTLQTFLRDFYEADKPVGAVCHGPAGLVGVTLSNGEPLIAGKKVNAFTNLEERDTTLDNYVPFLLESKIRDLGAIYVAAPNWTSHVEKDGNLVTGQNPQSTLAVTQSFIKLLG